MASLRRGRCRLPELLGEMSPAEFARRMSVAESTVSRWINEGMSMSLERAVMASFILDCHAEDVFEWELVKEEADGTE